MAVFMWFAWLILTIISIPFFFAAIIDLWNWFYNPYVSYLDRSKRGDVVLVLAVIFLVPAFWVWSYAFWSSPGIERDIQWAEVKQTTREGGRPTYVYQFPGDHQRDAIQNFRKIPMPGEKVKRYHTAGWYCGIYWPGNSDTYEILTKEQQ